MLGFYKKRSRIADLRLIHVAGEKLERKMLSYEEILSEIRRLSREEKLALLEEMIHSLRSEIATAAPHEQAQSWPPGFFEQTYGIFRDDPLQRLPQGDYETRDEAS